jgi:hypothetical protein
MRIVSQAFLSVREAKTGDRQLDARAIMRRLDEAIEAGDADSASYWLERRIEQSCLKVERRAFALRHQPVNRSWL